MWKLNGKYRINLARLFFQNKNHENIFLKTSASIVKSTLARGSDKK